MSEAFSPERWRQVKAIFQSAVDKDSKLRAAFLESECDGDEALRSEVERLLAADAYDPHFLESSPVHLASLQSLETSESSFIGIRLGPYRVIEEIGRGGMGAVYLAERTDGFAKRVAIKVIKRGMDTDDTLRRFRNERQILAHLEHQNIAHLLDGGTTDDGLPYFVMEYVEGSTIDEYCDDRNLDINERVKLFREVCAAVSYAHRHLAIHRDIKPSNILVTTEGTPKLLDFGIAKLLSPDAEEMARTATAMQLMTPEYASPEQIRGDTSITTATDVYSLGVVLYELLTGRHPYDFPNRRPDEVARIICETEPPRPSRAIAECGMLNADLKKGGGVKDKSNQQSAISIQQSKPHSAISNPKSLRGDLDNIVLMALRKDPSRRYGSVDQFSEDLRRYIAGLPVSARSDTLRYRTSKFVQRNKAATVAAALLLLTVLAGIGATLYQARRAEQQRALAEKRFNEVRELARSVVFKYHDAIEKLPGSTQVREMLVKDALAYLDRLSQDAAGDRSLQKELALAYLKVADVQGKAYAANVGDTAGAIISYRKAIVLFEALAASAAPSDEQPRIDLRDAYQALVLTMGVGGDKQTAEFIGKARSISEDLVKANPDNRDHKLKLARSYMLQSDMTSGLSSDQHMALFQQAQSILEDLVRAEPARVDFLTMLGTVYQRLGDRYRRAAKVAADSDDPANANQLFLQSARHHQLSKETVQKLVVIDPDNDRYRRLTAIAQNNYGEALVSAGDPKAAASEITAALHYFERTAIADEKNPNARYELGLARQTLASTLLQAADKKRAFLEYASAMKIFETLSREDPANHEYRNLSFNAAAEFGDTLLAVRDFDSALRQYQSLYQQLEGGVNTDPSKEGSHLSLIHERLGDVHAARAEEGKRDSHSQWLSAQTEYQKAGEGRPAARVEQLKKKISRCERFLRDK
ncbi:MAG TPA: protein kinase [Pyrinomonadaceae bacterium]|nr:protein kinase [Pyrinomonadaceae bacterium]